MSELKLKFIANFVDELTGPSRRVLGQFSNGVSTARNKMDRSLQTAGNLALVGGEATRMGGRIVDALTNPIEVAADFEEAMDAVKAITGANNQEFQQLTNTARQLGETTSFSASEAASGMRYLGMAGFESNEIIKSMPGVLDLAKAGATDLGRAADISSDILTGFGLSAQDMGRVGDVLAATFTSSNTTLEMLGDTMKYVGPLAKTAGVDLETMAAMTGLLGNAGIKGSQAGTTLRAMLTRLTAPTDAALKSLRSLGVEVENLDGNLKDPLDIIEDLQSGLEGLGNVEQMSLLKDIFGEEPAAGVAELILSQGRAGIEAYQQTIYQSQNTSQRIAKEMSDNTKGTVKEWRSAVESLNITVGTELLPTLTPLIKDVTDLAREMTAWASENPELIKTIFTVSAAIGGLLLIIGPVASVLSGLIGGFAVAKMAAATLASIGLLPLKMAFAGVIGVVKGLALTLGLNPIAIGVAAIAAGAVAIIANWDTVSGFFKELWTDVKAIFNGAINWINDLIDDPSTTLKQSWKSSVSFFKELWGDIQAITQTTMDTIKSIMDDPVGAIKKSWETLVSFFKGLWDGIKTMLGDAKDWIKDAITNPIETLKETFGGAWNFMTGISGNENEELNVTRKTVQETQINLFSAGNDGGESGSGLTQAGLQVPNVINEIAPNIAQPNIINEITSNIAQPNIINDIKNIMPDVAANHSNIELPKPELTSSINEINITAPELTAPVVNIPKLEIVDRTNSNGYTRKPSTNQPQAVANKMELGDLNINMKLTVKSDGNVKIDEQNLNRIIEAKVGEGLDRLLSARNIHG